MLRHPLNHSVFASIFAIPSREHDLMTTCLSLTSMVAQGEGRDTQQSSTPE